MKFLLLLSLIMPADAPVRGDSMACEVVRFYVRQYGETAAYEFARRKKWSRERVAWAKRCLKGDKGPGSTPAL